MIDNQELKEVLNKYEAIIFEHEDEFMKQFCNKEKIFGELTAIHFSSTQVLVNILLDNGPIIQTDYPLIDVLIFISDFM